MSYDSFGNSAASGRTRYLFTGREYDGGAGLYYYRARWYDAQVGRFLSEDPIGFEGGDVNLYAYVDNDPVNDTDPSGLQKKKRRDRWYGRNDSDFHKWFHRCWKRPGDPDADKDEIESAYAEWLSRGAPKGGNCYGGKLPEPAQCREPARSPQRYPSQKTLSELESEIESHRQMEIFWGKVLGGSIIGGGVVIGGPAVAAPVLRWIIGRGGVPILVGP